MLLINCLLSIACSYRLLLSYQQSGYKSLCLGYYNYSALSLGIFIAIITVMSFLADLIYEITSIYYINGSIVLVLLVIYMYYIFKSPFKKPLVFTKRLLRLVAVTVVLIILMQLIYFTKARNLVWLTFSILPLFIILADRVLMPLEKTINYRYLNNARLSLDRSGLIKIGITGSYGKTTIKNILRDILSRRYNVVATPSSFNTPLGIARATNQIDHDTEIFIAEMGARRRGDIKELTDIVKPTIGIVSGVNNQHLETFKTIETTMQTKYELIENLTGDKFAVVNSDNQYTLKMSLKGIPCTKVGFNKESDYVIDNIITSTYGTSFDLLYSNKKIELSTRLLGRHNALNIALCIPVALYLNVSAEDIKNAVYNLKPVSHRLELIQGARGITIIDDTYNSNPDGAKAALGVLEEFKGRKVIVTPGLIELGKVSRDENIKLGEEIGKICDLVILIESAQTEYILKGLGDYNKSKILTYKSLKDATVEFSKILQDNDVMLMLNDLPDSVGG